MCPSLCSFKMRCSQWSGRRGVTELLMGPLKKWTMPLRAPAAVAANPGQAAAAGGGGQGEGVAAAAGDAARVHPAVCPSTSPAAAAADAAPGHANSMGTAGAAAAAASAKPCASAAVSIVADLPRMGSVLPVVLKGSLPQSQPRSMAWPVVGEWVSAKVLGLQVVQVRGKMGDIGKQ